MNEWEIAAAVLGFALVPCLVVCLLDSAPRALPAFELAGVLLSTILILIAEGFHRQPFIDLAVVCAPMSLIGALAFARLMESKIEETEPSSEGPG
jgi:multisubunit Na+/H+ antiporter MnhF subunit